MRGVVEHKGIAQFGYVVRNQSGELINNDKLAEDFLKMYDWLGLLLDGNGRELLENDFASGGYGKPEDEDEELDR